MIDWNNFDRNRRDDEEENQEKIGTIDWDNFGRNTSNKSTIDWDNFNTNNVEEDKFLKDNGFITDQKTIKNNINNLLNENKKKVATQKTNTTKIDTENEKRKPTIVNEEEEEESNNANLSQQKATTEAIGRSQAREQKEIIKQNKKQSEIIQNDIKENPGVKVVTDAKSNVSNSTGKVQELNNNFVAYDGALIDTKNDVVVARNRESEKALNTTIFDDKYVEYKLNKNAIETAKSLDEEAEKGGWNTASAFLKNVGLNIAGGFSQSVFGTLNLLNAVPINATKKLHDVMQVVGNEEVANRLNNKYHELIDEGAKLNVAGNYISTINNKINNDFIRTSGDVSSVISRQVMDFAMGGSLGVEGAKVQAFGVAGSSFQETLNENPDNLEQANLTAALKGTAAYVFEKMFDANLLTRGSGSSSIEKQIVKNISKYIKSKSGKEVANFTVGVVGENVEEILEDNTSYLIDALVNNKELPSFEQWWANTTETIKTTTISTIIMNLLGFGGTSFTNKENEISTDQEFWLYETQKIIDKNNLSVIWDTNSILNLSGAGVFYSTTFNGDGNVESVNPVAGKIINNPNPNVDIEPVVIYNKENKTYNIIDNNTGLMLDSTPYKKIEIAENEFYSKMTNLDNAAINNINNRIAKANIAINQAMNEAVSQAESEINADRNVRNNTQTPSKNVQNTTESGTDNVNTYTNVDTNADNSTNAYTNVDTNTDNNTNAYTNVDTKATNMSDRNFENVSNKNVLPYQEEHTEVQPEIQEMANRFIEDLANSTEGKRYKTGNNWTGQKRNTTRELAYIKDNTGASWSQIGQALEDITNNKGNYALAKKVEIVLDDALTNGYRNIYGQNIMPNDNYISKKSNYESIQQSNNSNDDFKLDDYRVFGEKTPRKRNTAQTSQDKFSGVSNSNAINNVSQNKNANVGQNNTSNLSDEDVRNIVKYNPDGREISDSNYIDFLVERYKDNRNISGVVTDTRYVESIENKIKKDKISDLYEKIKDKEFKITKELRDENGELQNVDLDLVITKKGLNESFNKGFSNEKYAIVPYLDEIIKTSQDGTIRAETKMRSNIMQWYYLYNTAEINGELYGVKVDIKKTPQGDRFYVHRVNLVHKDGTANQIPAVGNGTIKINTVPSTNTSISQNNQSVKNSTNVNNNSMQNNENNTVRSERVDINSKIKYNSKGIKLSKREYANVMSLINTNKPNKTGIQGISSANYYYIYENNGFDNNTVLARIEIEGNEDLLNVIRRKIENETFEGAGTLIRATKEYRRNGRGFNNSNNASSQRARENGQTTRLHNGNVGQETRIEQGRNSEKSTRNKSGVNNGIRAEKETKSKTEQDLYNEIANNLIQTERNSLDQIEGEKIDNYVENTEEYEKAEKQVEYWNENGIEYDEDYLSDKFNEIYDKIVNALEKQGYAGRTNDEGEYVYDQYEAIQKGYNEILDYLDKNNLDYDVSSSTEAGELPSIYVKDADGNEFRIANHYNHQSTDYDKVYNRAYSNNEYINWKNTILKDMKNHLNISIQDNGIRAERTSNTAEYDNQGNKLSKAQRDFFKDSKVRDENGKLKVVYHGTQRADRVGNYFDPNKATSGPMAFFTDNREIATNYSTQKQDTSLSREYDTEFDLFKVNGMDLDTYWNSLKSNQKQEIINRSNNIGFDEDFENIIYEANASRNSFGDQFEWRLKNEYNGNALRSLYSIWIEDGNLMQEDMSKFKTVLEYAGLSNIEYLDLYKTDSNVYEVYLNIKNPFDTSNISKNIIKQLENASKTAKTGEMYSADLWDKSNISPKAWIEKLHNDLENNSTHAWTVIPDWVTNVLKTNGYDGIIDTGGKGGGVEHQVVIPFYSNQIKNITNKKPTTSNPDIRYESTNNSTSQPYDARRYEKNADFVNYLKENNYLKTLMEVDEKQGETYAHSADRLIEQEIRKLEETNGFDNSIPVTKLTDIDREIENYLGKTIGKGHFRERARGIYNQKTDNISVKEYKDLDNVFHELGHALDLGGRIKVDKSSLSNELLAAVKRHGGYENETIGVQLDEGFAEILKTYAINKDIVKADYPKSYRVLEDFKASDVNFGKFITKIQQDTYNYIHQNPQNRILSNVSIGEQTDKAPITANTVKENVVKVVWDSNYSIKEMVNQFAKVNGNKLSPSQNAYLLTRLASGVDNKAISMISNGYVDLNGNRLMPGLNKLGEILGNNQQRWNDLRTYLVAKRDLEYKAKSLRTGIRTMDSKAVVEQFYNDSQIQEAAQVVYDTLDGVLQYAVNNKLITEETAKSLRESNAFYVPFQRVIEGKGNTVGRRGAVADIINKRTGSELDIKDVLENIVANSTNIIQQVENNNILQALAEQGEEAGISNNIFKEIPPPMKNIGKAQLSTWEAELKNQGVDTSNLDLEKTIDLFVPNNNIITEKDGSHIVSFFDKNGKRKYLQFYKSSTDIFNALMGLDKNANSVFLRLMRAANMPLRYGATMANVGFAIPNMISDTVQATIYSEAGFIPVVDNVIGILDILGATNKTVRNFLNQVAPEYAQRINRIYDIYQQTGASSSTRMSQYRKSTQEIMRDIYGTKNSEVLGIKDSFKPLKRLMDILTYIPELSESSTRFRVFERNYEATKNKGSSELDARIQAAIESRDATQDFGRTGTVMKEVNQLIPFSAARVGSAYTFAEKVKANPKRTAARVAILLTVALAIKAIGYDDDEIEELNQRKKDDNFVFKVGDTVITIKKPQGILRSIINLGEYILDLSTGHIEEGKEGERLVEWTTNAIMDNMPADSVTGLVPNPIAPIVENAINRDFYYNTDIVKSYDLDLPDEQQYYDYTSQLAIWLGKIFNYSPAKIDNLFSGYLGGLGTQLTNTIDWISGKMGLSAEEPAMGAEDNAIGKRFVVNVNENSASVDEIYEREEELTKKQNGGTITAEEEQELEEIKAGITKMSALNKQIKAIKQDLTMSGEEKAEAIRPLQEQKVDVARQALGKDPIYTENTDELNSLEFYPSRSTLSYNGYTLELTEDMKQEYEDLAYDLYKKYEKQGLYSEDYLDKLKSKCKDAAKKQIMQKYRSKLTKSK